MSCIQDFKLSPAVILRNRMGLMRQGIHVSFHDLDPYDIATMMSLTAKLIERKPNLGFYELVLEILEDSMAMASRYHSHEATLARSARQASYHHWRLNGVSVLDHYHHMYISLLEHRNPYRAIQVAYKVAYCKALQT